MQLSGKLVVSSIVTIALLGAVASWWFRYNATNEAVAYWGPEAVRLIRDAPHVSFMISPQAEPGEQPPTLAHRLDVSRAPGITHLRHALLENRSYDPTISFRPERPSSGQVDDYWTSALEFRRNPAEVEPALTILFSRDHRFLCGYVPRDSNYFPESCAPIADGLEIMFHEMAGASDRQ